jgi:LDH2 family malate/lactate/ureidoglycolate dehydrogenase
MPQGTMCDHRKLKAFCTDLFIGYGFTPEHAASIADCLVTTDMRGIRSHGTVRVEMYLTQMKKGAIDPKGVPEIVRDNPTSAVIDGHKAAGAPVCDLAFSLAREKAEKYGMGMVTVRNSNHFGPAGHWAVKLAGTDMIGLAATNGPPLVAAPCSCRAVIGNNPFSVAVPGSKNPNMCVDISNGMMAFGKIHEYRRLNKPFPENCWLDDKGEPTTDPFATDFLKFISLPFGMHKGFCLAVIVEALTSMLAGGAVAEEFAPPGCDLDASNPTSHVFMAVRLEDFIDPAAYKAKADWLIDYFHDAKTRRENDKVLYPGELENLSYAKALEEGIFIPDNVKEYLLSAARAISLSVDPTLF